MSEFSERVRSRLARLRAGSADADAPEEDLSARRQLALLRRRVNELEAEVIENRQLARRIAELTDIVEQLLLPDEVRNASRLEERLGQIRARR